MTGQDRGTQTRVGIFMAIGLGIIAAMVVYFGRFGDSVRSYYHVRVEYPNAAGIYKGASVLLSGAKVGMVESNPVLLDDLQGVYVNLKIYDEVKIPSAAEFTIGSSGLLGDKFVQIILKKNAQNSPPIEPGAVIQGKGEAGLGELTEQAPEILAEIKEAVGSINSVVRKLDTEVFQDASLGDLRDTMANLKSTTASFAEASKKVDSLVKRAEKAIDTGEATMVSAKSAADELQKTIVTFRGTGEKTLVAAEGAAGELKKALADVRSLLAQAKQGRGALGVLLSDRETADNLRALVINLRRHGILWYKDRAQPAAESER